MAIIRRDERLDKAVSTDIDVVPRYKFVRPDGTVYDGTGSAEHLELVLENPVLQEGMPYNADFANENLSASGTTTGTATALELAQPEYYLFDGAVVRFKNHVVLGPAPFTLNVNNTGAKPVKKADDMAIESISPGAWVTVIYSATAGAYLLEVTGSSGDMLRKDFATQAQAKPGYVDKAVIADKFTTPRTLRTNLASTAGASFDGSADAVSGVQGTLPVANGGSGVTASPSMLVNLAATAAANVFQATPRPGVTGVLPLANGGTAQTTWPGIRGQLFPTSVVPQYLAGFNASYAQGQYCTVAQLEAALAIPKPIYGTWSPALAAVGGSFTHTLQNGVYAKIGRLVLISGRIDWSARTGSSPVYMSGLPFAFGTGLGNTSSIYGMAVVGGLASSVLSTAATLAFVFGTGAYQPSLMRLEAGTTPVATNFRSSGTLGFGGSYISN